MIYTIKNQFLGSGDGIPISKLQTVEPVTTEEKLIKIREELKAILSGPGAEEGLEFITYMEEAGIITEEHLEKFFNAYF